MLETKDLLHYPASCTFALVHEPSKTVVLYDTINFFKTLGEVLSKLQNDEYDHPVLHDYKHQLRIELVSSEQNLSIRRQLFSGEIESYKQKGYVVLNRKKTLLKYKIKTIMTRFNRQSVVCVVKVNSRNEKFIMGIFHNLVEADRFMSQFNNSTFVPEVYADNELTKQYLDSKYNIPLRL